jgi:hypothetical protein
MKSTDVRSYPTPLGEPSTLSYPAPMLYTLSYHCRTPALETLCVRWMVSEDVAGATFMAIGSAAPEIVINMIAVVRSVGTVPVFRQKFTLEDAIVSHACSAVEASKRVTNDIPLGWPLLLPVHTVNSVQTRKVPLATPKLSSWGYQQCSGPGSSPSSSRPAFVHSLHPR